MGRSHSNWEAVQLATSLNHFSFKLYQPYAKLSNIQDILCTAISQPEAMTEYERKEKRYIILSIGPLRIEEFYLQANRINEKYRREIKGNKGERERKEIDAEKVISRFDVEPLFSVLVSFSLL